MALLGHAIQAALGGAGRVLIVRGKAGYGKSRLLEEALRCAEAAGFRIGIGSAFEADRLSPMVAVFDVLFGSDRALFGIESPPHPPSGTLSPRYWLAAELGEMLEELALARPITVAIDDLQWADTDSLAVIRSLPPALADLPIIWLLSTRPEEAGTGVREALRHLEARGAMAIDLPPLKDTTVVEMLAAELGGAPAKEVVDLAGRAAGSPFLLSEMIAGWREDELLGTDGAVVTLREARMPGRLAHSAREQLDRIDPGARRTAVAAATLGQQFRLEDLATMLETTPTRAWEEAEGLVRKEVLIASRGLLRFRHDLLREAILEALPDEVIRTHRRRAAATLLAAGSVPAAVAETVAASAEPGDAQAIEILRLAASNLGSSNPSAAADLAMRALELMWPGDASRGALVAEIAILLHAAARIEEGQHFAERALRELLPSDQEAEVCLGLGSMISLSPDLRSAMARRGLSLSGVRPETRARLNAALIHNLLSAGRPREAAAALPAAASAADEAGDATASFTIALGEAGVTYAGDDLAGALGHLDRALRTRHQVRDPVRARMSEQWMAEVQFGLDRPAEALELLERGSERARSEGQAWAIRWFDFSRGRMLFQLGRLDDARAALEGILATEVGAGVSVIDLAGLVALGRVGIHQGDRSLLARALDLIAPSLSAGEPGQRRHAAWLTICAGVAGGEHASAQAALAGLDEESSGSVLPSHPTDHADPITLLRLALRVGDDRLVRDACALSAARARANPGVVSLAGIAAQCEALGPLDDDGLDEAVELLHGSPRRLAYASALEDSGRAALAADRPQKAIARQSQALELYADLGAEWDAARVRSRLRDLGVRRRLRSRRPARGWEGLTESELRVVRLVSGGKTNRQVATELFVSPHTVSMHLRHAFAKLGVTSRVELAAIVASHPQVDGA
jgi:DNA-binding CsgD family transcriptional regulator/tetratricopeptide (TPR) repeat protein